MPTAYTDPSQLADAIPSITAKDVEIEHLRNETVRLQSKLAYYEYKLSTAPWFIKWWFK